jgi:predicted phage terminase large subunit-like protein
MSRFFLHGWRNSPLQELEESGELRNMPLLEQGILAACLGADTDFKSRGIFTVEQRKKAKESLIDFTTMTFPQYQVSWHHRLLAKKLEQVYRGEIKRLMVNMPPRHGKSELVSRRFPAWVLGKNPEERIIACSYSADLASSINRDVQRIIQTPEYEEIFPETRLNEKNVVTTAERSFLKNSRIFEVVGRKGYYLSAGVGGPIVGRGFYLGIIDDPIKNREEASSYTYREKTWDWYRSTFLTRGEGKASPGGEERIVATWTRWHEDDLGGRILQQAKLDKQDWEILSLPAILDCDPCVDDPREYGQPLWKEKYPLEKLEVRKLEVGTREWEAQYQQRPSPLEGGMFKREWWRFYEYEPYCDSVIMTWDMAFKDASESSYVVGQVWGCKGANRYLLDQFRGQVDFLSTIRAFRQMCEKWPTATAKLVEDKANGPAIISVLKDKISGIIPITPKGDKELRALSIVPLVEAGNVFLPRGKSFSEELIEEAAAFPTGVHDDQIDAMSQGLNYLNKDPIRAMEELVRW